MAEIIANFDVSPRIIKVLGEELIHDKKIAIAELVKNAYDADATLVKITIATDKIIIEDDGHGMNADIIKNYWLKPGSSKKRDSTERTPKFKRLPLGEKGVGRLGVHRLGDQIEVISKSKNHKEVSFKLNWEVFENQNNLQDIPPILIEDRVSPSEFNNNRTGTKLIIESLKEQLEEKDIATLHSDLLKLLSPFQDNKKSSLHINLYDHSSLFAVEKELKLQDLLDNAFFTYDIAFEGENITSFTYDCISPNQDMHPSRTVDLSDEKYAQEIPRILDEKIKELIKDDDYSISLHQQSNLGQVRFRGYIFEAKLSRLFKNPLDKSVKAYLKENGGIRVYRDGIRIYNYGEGGKDNDILNLDRKRASKLGDNIGYNQILAAIELDRQSSTALIETTSREGFIHNKSFLYLQQKLDLCMELVTHFRKLDKAEMRLLEGKTYEKADIDTRISEITKQVNKLDIKEFDKAKINKSLDQFSSEFKRIKEIFLTASNTGLNMTFIIHEMDKIIDHLAEAIESKNLSQIAQIFGFLQDTIQSYKAIIRLDKKALPIKLNSIIAQAIFNSQYRFECHNITLEKNLNSDISIICKTGLIIGILSNLFDNAIYWLDHYQTKNKQIFIKSYSDHAHHHLVIADNGKGFNISFEAALGPFISGRVDESSMGIGLFLAAQVMQVHSGTISDGSQDVTQIPAAFINGAIIKLSFPKEVK